MLTQNKSQTNSTDLDYSNQLYISSLSLSVWLTLTRAVFNNVHNADIITNTELNLQLPLSEANRLAC